jgi:outer membrane lipoprotein-sorting protein
MPSWWERWRRAPVLRSGFRQEGESAAFGTLTRTGTILAAKGGRLRLEYDKGALLVSDGRLLTQYDPSTRTAQSFEIEGALEDLPLLRILLEPLEIGRVFDAKHQGGGRVVLSPRRPGLPEVALEGRGDSPRRIEWVDATGARQVLTLTDPKIVPDPKGRHFTFDAPKGTKWVR